MPHISLFSLALQMIQQQRLLQKTQIGSVPANGSLGSRTIDGDASNKTDKPLYVVYPMQSLAGINKEHRPNGEIATISTDQIHKPSTIQQFDSPYTMEKSKSRYILNSRPAYEFEKKSDQIEAIAENDEEDR